MCYYVLSVPLWEVVREGGKWGGEGRGGREGWREGGKEEWMPWAAQNLETGYCMEYVCVHVKYMCACIESVCVVLYANTGILTRPHRLTLNTR